MRINPEYAMVDGKKYKINTDYRVALKCDEVARNPNINEYKKPMIIIYLLFGEIALKNPENYEKFFKQAVKFLRLGNLEDKEQKSVKDFDFEQDYRLVKDSVLAERGIDIEKENIHFWDFFDTLNGLTDKCILNRVREIRTYDTTGLSSKQKTRIEELKREFALEEKVTLSEKQMISAEAFEKAMKGVN
jgi:hypothetical protein